MARLDKAQTRSKAIEGVALTMEFLGNSYITNAESAAIQNAYDAFRSIRSRLGGDPLPEGPEF